MPVEMFGCTRGWQKLYELNQKRLPFGATFVPTVFCYWEKTKQRLYSCSAFVIGECCAIASVVSCAA